MATYQIAEDGRNGTVTITTDGLERTIKKRIGKDDHQFIPLNQIGHVSHDRKTIGTDRVTVAVGANSFTWKVKRDADGFVQILQTMLAGQR